jgi:hypothetical protein
MRWAEEANMKRFLRAAPATLLPFILAGCGEWVHPTKPPHYFAQDNAVCRQLSIEAVGSKPQRQSAPKWMNRATGYSSYIVDANEDLRDSWRTSCLEILGWSLR